MDTETVDTARPIRVIDMFGKFTPAVYLQQQVMWPDRYEIMWLGKRWTVNAEHQIQGPTETEEFIDPGFRVTNRQG